MNQPQEWKEAGKEPTCEICDGELSLWLVDRGGKEYWCPTCAKQGFKARRPISAPQPAGKELAKRLLDMADCWRVGYLQALLREAAAALSQDAPSTEPVAWIEHHKGGDNLVWERTNLPCDPLYAAPAPSAECPSKAVCEARHKQHLEDLERLAPSALAGLRELEAEHSRYHATGMCYGDSHADYMLRIAALSERGTSAPLADRLPERVQAVQEAWDSYNASKIEADEFACFVATALQLELRAPSQPEGEK